MILGGGALIATAVLVGYAGLSDTPAPEPPAIDWDAYAAPPVDELAVYWVGHSLLNHRDPQIDDAPHLMEEVGRLAEARGLAYRYFDQTLFGANLSLAVRGEPHTYSRQEPDFAAKRDELRDHAGDYDALVLTEGIPVRNAERGEYSAFYAMQLHCDFVRGNPDGRTYLFEAPVHLQGSDSDGGYGPRDEFGWASFMEDDRRVWERIADQAQTGMVPTPGLGPRLATILGLERDDGCTSTGPIFLIPAASVLVHLVWRLANPGPDDVFELREHELLTMAHLFQNPYVDWPSDWPLPPHEGPSVDEESVIETLHRAHPDAEYDDIHPSRIGTYVNALTAFAVLYRRSPVDEAELALEGEAAGLPEETARTLQRIVWDVVRTDPRTGVGE